jgi:hypothetical protein
MNNNRNIRIILECTEIHSMCFSSALAVFSWCCGLFSQFDQRFYQRVVEKREFILRRAEYLSI